MPPYAAPTAQPRTSGGRRPRRGRTTRKPNAPVQHVEFERGWEDRATTRRPAAALTVVPSLREVKPVLPQVELDRFHAKVALQKREDVRPILMSLLALSGVKVEQHQPLGAQVKAWLEAAYPLPEHEVSLKADKGKIQFTFETYADGLYPVGKLHRALRQVDPLLLPALLRTLEKLSAALHPTFGPVGMQQYAEYIWSLEQLTDFHLLERMMNPPAEISSRMALNLARKLALPHEYLIRDQTPQVYFSVRDTPEETVERLRRAVLDNPRQTVVQGLAPLLDLLPQLQRLSRAVPDMSDQEAEKINFLPPIGSVLTPSPKPYCAVAECADDFMRSHWEGGEHEPHYCLLMDNSRASQKRVLDLLALIPPFMACHGEVLRVICDAQDL